VAVKLVPQYVGRICIVKATATDAQGREIPTANNHIRFRLLNSRLLGVGNGDPSSHEADNAPERSLFNGLAQVIITRDGDAEIIAESDGLKSASLKLAMPQKGAE
jgi:beta-galactosidase